MRRGFTAPLHAGAPGRAFLALRGDAAEYLKLAPFAPLVLRTLTTADQLIADIAQTRQRGYAVAAEDVIVGMATIGMPIYDNRRQLRGCVSLGGLTGEVQEREVELVAALRSGVRSFEGILAASRLSSQTTNPS